YTYLVSRFYHLSLHDALPICLFEDASGPPGLLDTSRRGDEYVSIEVLDHGVVLDGVLGWACTAHASEDTERPQSCSTRRDLHALDRKSTRLNSSHSQISYAVF